MSSESQQPYYPLLGSPEDLVLLELCGHVQHGRELASKQGLLAHCWNTLVLVLYLPGVHRDESSSMIYDTSPIAAAAHCEGS